MIFAILYFLISSKYILKKKSIVAITISIHLLVLLAIKFDMFASSGGVLFPISLDDNLLYFSFVGLAGISLLILNKWDTEYTYLLAVVSLSISSSTPISMLAACLLLEKNVVSWPQARPFWYQKTLSFSWILLVFSILFFQNENQIVLKYLLNIYGAIFFIRMIEYVISWRLHNNENDSDKIVFRILSLIVLHLYLCKISNIDMFYGAEIYLTLCTIIIMAKLLVSSRKDILTNVAFILLLTSIYYSISGSSFFVVASTVVMAGLFIIFKNNRSLGTVEVVPNPYVGSALTLLLLPTPGKIEFAKLQEVISHYSFSSFLELILQICLTVAYYHIFTNMNVWQNLKEIFHSKKVYPFFILVLAYVLINFLALRSSQINILPTSFATLVGVWILTILFLRFGLRRKHIQYFDTIRTSLKINLNVRKLL